MPSEHGGKIDCPSEPMWRTLRNRGRGGGVPELTPVAIALDVVSLVGYTMGQLEMDYATIATAVYTPLEYGCVGLSEEEAREKYKNVETYRRVFVPLEYSMVENRNETECFSKIVVDMDTGLVAGIHYMGPNAGDIIQGWALCVKKGVTYRELIETVGVHPTCGEEIVNTTASKSSGEEIAKAGC